MPVKPKSAVKSKSASKTKPTVKKKSTVKPNKKIISKQYDVAHLAEEIISNVCVGIYIVQNGNFVYVSPLFQRLSGYSPSDLLGTNPLDHVHSEDRETVRKSAIKSLKGNGSSYEYRFVRKNGEIIWVMEMITSIIYKGKRAALGSFMDITEHKRTEDELRRSEEKYRTIMENMEEGYFEVDLAGNFTFVNDAECRNMGYSREELIGMNNRQYTDEENAKKAFQAFSNLYKTGESCEIFDYEVTRKDGTKAFAELLVSLIKDSSGKPIGFRGLSRHITERKQAEKTLELRMKQLSALSRASQAVAASLELDHVLKEIVLLASEAVASDYTSVTLIDEAGHLSRSAENVPGLPTLERRAREKGFTSWIMQSHQPVIVDEIGADGSVIFAFDLGEGAPCFADLTLMKLGVQSLAGLPMLVKDRLLGVLYLHGLHPAVFHDQLTLLTAFANQAAIAIENARLFEATQHELAERKCMEDELRQSEEKYRTILENIEDGYTELDLRGNFIFFNEALCRIQGYPKEELIKKTYRDLMDEENAKKIFAIYNKVFTTGESEKEVPYEIITKSGLRKHLETSITPIKDASGRIFAFRGIVRDRTERRQAEDLLRQSEETYRSMIEQMADGYFETDLTGKFTFINDAECNNLGYTREELIDRAPKLYADEKSAKASYRLFVEVYKTGKPVTAYDFELVKKDGTKSYNEISVSLIRNSKGEPTGFRGIARDVTKRKQAEDSLRQSEEKYRTFIETIQDGYYEIDLNGKYTFLNDVICQHLQYSKEELIGKDNRQYQTKENSKKAFQKFVEVYTTGNPIKAMEMEVIRKDGSIQISEVSISLIRNAEGTPISFRGTSRDITGRKQMEETIRESEERYRTIIEEMQEWYFETDLTGNITFFNDIFANVLGYSQKELTGLNFRTFIKKEESESVYRLFNQVFKTGKSTKNFPYEFVRPDGTVTSAEFSIFPKWDKEAKIVGFRGVGHDITERKRAEEKIQHMATHDALTGLPNRLMFSQLLNHAIQSAKRYQRQFAVFFIDLDRFKTINDSLGHEAGDKLLQEIALRFKQSLRAVDVVGRLGGDEFVILIEEISDSSQIATVAHKILTAAIKPMVLLGEECRVTASIGISMYPKDAEDEQDLMKNADIAMYLAKEEGKNNYQFYSEDIQSKSIERLSIETNLRFALERNELSLHYQAKVDFKTNAITGVEALLRWQNPYLGSVTPTQFIPVAEESWLIIPIGRWVIRTACAQNVAWQREGLPPVCMAVNLSPRQLMDEFLVEDIKNALNDSGMAPNLLELEITESMVMHNPTRMIAVLAKIKNLGVRLAIDDFGTGYSSLAQIKHFPIDTLKVDRSFIRNIPQDSEDKAITEAIIAMGKTLSLTVVAEGVETQEQEDFLREHSCDEMQGFYFSKPIAPDQFAELLRKHVPSPQK